MKIIITSGSGTGLTELSAFDHALYNAGIANYNLIRLSSVIPINSDIELNKIDWNNQEIGYKLYVVLACNRTSEVGKEVWAGIGWMQKQDKGGVFVEHKGDSEEEVKNLITNSLETMRTYRNEEFGEINYKIVGKRCDDKPVCSLVAAIYKSEGWE